MSTYTSTSASPRLRRSLFLSATLVGFVLLLSPAQADQGERGPGKGSWSLAQGYDAAATRYGVPRDLLLAIGYANTRWQPLEGRPGRDHGYGPMHLTVPPGSDSLLRAARLLDVPPDRLKSDDAANILAGAALLREIGPVSRAGDLASWYPAVAAYSGFADPRVADSYAGSVFDILREGAQAITYSDETLAIPPHPELADPGGKSGGSALESFLSDDYGPAFWVPAHTNNYQQGRNGNAIRYIVIHDTEGSYQSAINWFQNPSSGVSAHYVLRSRDGEITQMVRDSDTGYHAGNFSYNLRSVGIEHEGFASQNTWYTEAMYSSSAELARTLADRYGVRKDHAHIIGHYQVPLPNTHTDPGPYWRWEHYLSKVRRDWARAALLDNTDPGFTANPPVPGSGWQVFAGRGYNGSNSYMALSTLGAATHTGAWHAALPVTATYDLYAFIPYINNANPETQSATYMVTTLTGTIPVVMDQKALTDAGVLQNGTTQGEWGHIGRFTLGRSPVVTLNNHADDTGRNVWFDALMWIPANEAYPLCAQGSPPGTGQYAIAQSTGAAIVPGATDVGNHCDDCTTTITLPFTYNLYDHPFIHAVLGSNGTIGFATNSNVYTNTCVPAAQLSYAILPYWDDLRTDGAGNGIFTSVSGSSPNRILNIAWRASYYTGAGTAHFEARLYENQARFDFIYDVTTQGGNVATVGVQRDTGSRSTQLLCETGGLQPGLLVSFTLTGCPPAPSPTPTPTGTRTRTSTVVPTLTATRTATRTITPTPVRTATPTNTTVPTLTPTRTATHTATRTVTSTPVSTATMPITFTLTPAGTGTATPCTIQFTDVAPTDYFYEPVRYLYCAGAISGYADNTFRPYNNTTRGQLCKIVVLAEGWPLDTSGGPHFVDVPTDNPFYPYVETAFNRGVISGYSCGVDCLEFRWGNNVTRAQLCKIVVQAEGWAIDTHGGPHFQDVPESDPFYGYIETAYNHAIISGYGCGPKCLEFRPGNSATRGQISKIVYQTITHPLER